MPRSGGAGGIDDPVGMAEISSAIGRELGLRPSHQPVATSGGGEQGAGHRDGTDLATNRDPQHLAKVAVAPALGVAVIGLDHAGIARNREGEKQAGEVVDVDQR